jgi:hypothetical protein
MNPISTLSALNIKGIKLCECRYYQTHGTCWHIDPGPKREGKELRLERSETLDKLTQSPTPKTQPSSENTSHKFMGLSPRDKALKFLESLRSKGIQSELKEEDSRFYVFFQKQGWKGNTYSYVKIFS